MRRRPTRQRSPSRSAADTDTLIAAYQGPVPHARPPVRAALPPPSRVASSGHHVIVAVDITVYVSSGRLDFRRRHRQPCQRAQDGWCVRRQVLSCRGS